MSWNDREKRADERQATENRILVRDRMTGQELGVVVNFHHRGFMMIGNAGVQENHVYQLILDVSDIETSISSLQVGAECLWVRESDSCTQHWAGFQIIDASEEDIGRVAALMPQIAP